MLTPQRLDTIFIWFTPNGPKCLTNCQPKSLQANTQKKKKKHREKNRKKSEKNKTDRQAISQHAKTPRKNQQNRKKKIHTKKKKQLELGKRNRTASVFIRNKQQLATRSQIRQEKKRAEATWTGLRWTGRLTGA